MWNRRIALLAAAAFVFMHGASARLLAADAETRAFNNAEAARQDGFPDRAERLFGEFISRFPNSPRVPQALLKRSNAALQQKKFQPAIEILTTNMTNAASMADQFQFAIATTYAESGQLDAAATNFALLVARYTNSALRLDATLSEARARFRLRQLPRVVTLLREPNGVFQQAANQDPESERVVRGRMLLAETLLEQNDFAAAEEAARAISTNPLGARTKWEREYLIAKSQWNARQLTNALGTSSNLLTLASATVDPALDAASSALMGEIFEALNRPEEAITAYARNQRPGVPAGRAREALFKIVELNIAQGRLTNALERLQESIAARPGENGSDVALLTLAELRLKQHQLHTTNATAAPGPDLLADVVFDCDKLLTQFTNSPFVSKAHLVRAWALLAQGKTVESLAAFRLAAQTLPWSEAQAVAHFKTADLEFQLRDLTNALANYRTVITNYQVLPRVQEELVPRARYQMLQASLGLRDLAAAQEVLAEILRDYPVNDFAERSLLLFGQTVDELHDGATARKTFSRFIELFPNSALRAEVELAIAKSHERERDWPAAITKYDEWVAAHPSNSSLARVEFLRATANFQAGRETNALNLFTNFVARFPLNPLAARAQNWVGDFYLRQGRYDQALENFQRVFENTNWPVTTLSYQARLKAGRAALLRPSFAGAVYHFTNLIENANCPTSVLVQAYFAYGDAYRERPWTNALENYNAARKIYEEIPKNLPSDDPLVSRAWGEVARCYFQLATENPARYGDALDYYGRITNATSGADATTRLMARVGIGDVFRAQSRLAREKGSQSEATALLNRALTNYLDVVLPLNDDIEPDSVWLKEATLSAAEICQSLGEWQRAINLYRRLAERVPALRVAAEKRIEAVQREMEKETL